MTYTSTNCDNYAILLPVHDSTRIMIYERYAKNCKTTYLVPIYLVPTIPLRYVYFQMLNRRLLFRTKTSCILMLQYNFTMVLVKMENEQTKGYTIA